MQSLTMSSSQCSSEHVTRYRNEDVSVLLRYANNKRHAGFFNDVTVRAGTESIPANRMVLSCYSKFFETMFLTNFKEQYQDCVEIHQFDGKSVKMIIQYIYTGFIALDKYNVMNLLAAADFLQMDDVKSFCFDFLESSLTVDNCIDIYKISSLYNNLKSLNKTYRVISNNFHIVMNTESFQALSKSDFVFLLPKLDPNNVQESLRYTAIINWVRHDKNREQDFPILFLSLDLEKFSMQFLKDVVTKEKLVQGSTDCMNAVMSCTFKKFQDLKDSSVDLKNQPSSSKLTAHTQATGLKCPTKLKPADSKIICLGGEGKKSVVEVYNSSSGCSNQIYPDLPYHFSRHCVEKLQDVIYCIGGILDNDMGKRTNKAYQMDLKASKLSWKQIASMKEKRSSFGVAIFGNSLVVAGGRNSDSTLNSVESYEVQRNIWRKISPMQQGRKLHALIAANNSLFAIGGKDEYPLSSVEQLDNLLGNWKQVHQMNVPRFDFAAVCCNGFIYVLGGAGISPSRPSNTVEKYDVENNQWSFNVESMYMGRSAHAACVLNNHIFVVGGFGKAHQTIECYNPTVDQWSTVDVMAHAVFNHAVVTI